jgi:thiol-disulfide isomerase/thioredoxin
MIKKAITLLFIFTLTASIMAQEDESTLNKVGDMAPAFKATTIDGKLIDTKELKGKVIWVNFFATWCPPCKKELPVLEENVYKKYLENDDFVLVVLGREHTVEELKAFAEEFKHKLPFAPDIERKIFALYAKQSIPRNVIIDKEGNISLQSIGYTEKEFAEIEEHVSNLLSK